jgi:hypothetical protein
MSRTLRPLAVLAMVALISVISAGCGSDAPSETGTGSSTGTGGTKKATDRDKAVKFAECMRENGARRSTSALRSREQSSSASGSLPTTLTTTSSFMPRPCVAMPTL